MKEYNVIIFPIELYEYLCHAGKLCSITELNSNKWYNVPIEELEFSRRIYKCLSDCGRIRSVGQLTEWTESELVGLKNFGVTSLREVKRKLNDLGLRLGQFK